jgi:hypothetical protein
MADEAGRNAEPGASRNAIVLKTEAGDELVTVQLEFGNTKPDYRLPLKVVCRKPGQSITIAFLTGTQVEACECLAGIRVVPMAEGFEVHIDEAVHSGVYELKIPGSAPGPSRSTACIAVVVII